MPGARLRNIVTKICHLIAEATDAGSLQTQIGNQHAPGLPGNFTESGGWSQ